ncbi:MAG: LolA family protein [Alphaproteobacteria bacterium]|jgi:outer membrane lipoprotein-sorting protein|nr:outer membrane lipoprotein carrier protein LolA [Candidatus Jidaibacter sp.]
MKYPFYILCIVFAICFNAEAKQQNKPDDSKLVIKSLESYMLNISTLEAEFEQLGNASKSRKGKLFIKKPNEARIEYYTPENELIIVSEGLLVYYNFELEEKNLANPNDMFLDFIFNKNFMLTRDAQITKFVSFPDRAEVAFKIKKDPMDREITIRFAKNPVEISSISVLNNNETISLMFNKLEINGFINDRLFNLDYLVMSK